MSAVPSRWASQWIRTPSSLTPVSGITLVAEHSGEREVRAQVPDPRRAVGGNVRHGRGRRNRCGDRWAQTTNRTVQRRYRWVNPGESESGVHFKSRNILSMSRQGQTSPLGLPVTSAQVRGAISMIPTRPARLSETDRSQDGELEPVSTKRPRLVAPFVHRDAQSRKHPRRILNLVQGNRPRIQPEEGVRISPDDVRARAEGCGKSTWLRTAR